MSKGLNILFQIALGASSGVAVLFLLSPHTPVSGSTNISPSPADHWGWNDLIGWIDFYNTNTVTVTNTQLTGYASSSIGYISLDCATSPSNNICGTSNYKVYNDGLGGLSGYAWNDTIGWISFCGGPPGTVNCPDNAGHYSYQTLIDPSTGIFQGTTGSYAWNDVVGWFAFNCLAVGGGSCSVPFDVITSWRAVAATGTLDSSTFDTGVAGGGQINSVVWRGNQPPGTLVGFQFAASNVSSGPWNFTGPGGNPSAYFYPSAAGVSAPVDYALYNNQRFFRYRVTLFSDPTQVVSPQVKGVIVSWSP